MLLLATFTCLVAVISGERLLATIVLHRHGDRNPLTTYKTDPYHDESHWPEGKGHLNKAGLQRQYELGAWLRTRYRDFLPTSYSPLNLKVISTDVDRTLISAQVTLAGLYPAEPLGLLPWQPIPVHTTPPRLDAFLAFRKACKKFDRLMNELMTSPELTHINDVNRELYDLVSDKTGQTIDSVYNLEVIYNTLLTELLANKTLPDWSLEVFPQKMKETAILRYKIPCYNAGLARLRVGLLFGGFLSFFRESGEIPKMLLLSAHDSTIADVLTALGIFNNEIPPYSSALLIELYETRRVKISFKNGTEVFKLVLKDCQFDCQFDKFAEILEPLTIPNETQWDKECEN